MKKVRGNMGIRKSVSRGLNVSDQGEGSRVVKGINSIFYVENLNSVPKVEGNGKTGNKSSLGKSNEFVGNKGNQRKGK